MSSPVTPSALPQRLLYSISARLGGYGLDSDSFEALRASHRAGILAKAVAYDNRQREIPRALITSLRWHPVRLLSFLGSAHYYGAKKHALDRFTRGQLPRGAFDLFHSWSGDCLLTLREARARGIPSVLEIPTWHRNKGKIKPALTKTEREKLADPLHRRVLHSCLVSRQQVMEEYDLASLILVLSEKAAETFTIAGVPREKLFLLPRGTDTARFTPGPPPPLFRAVYTGALLRRKGVHVLLEAWHRLALKDAELVLVGTVHPEIQPALDRFAGPTVKVAGFAPRPEDHYRQASVHIFPSSCEGSAKVTYDAAACGLAQITTRESGDAVVDGVTGLVVPPENPDALAAAIEHLHARPELLATMGAAARTRMVENFTWEHYRQRLLTAYAQAARSLAGRAD